jgi:hypothetical protein
MEPEIDSASQRAGTSNRVARLGIESWAPPKKLYKYGLRCVLGSADRIRGFPPCKGLHMYSTLHSAHCTYAYMHEEPNVYKTYAGPAYCTDVCEGGP